ncbi:MAG: MotB family protein [Gammaproteobacteria bacterium SHHR-1]|uniref:MotB family protein n=1 Tax=Magnetovirga frankeli TaxID=947516 RepID=UPI0012937C15|nr:OmpA family protein [gamma proteobacterium SS-5]
MEEEDCPKCEEGSPAWMATFADLMSLLMCFFVLLLSFATLDQIRFKKMAETLKDAFGVQREIPASEVVKGVSVIKQEFSPSTIPEPSQIDEIRQITQDERQELKVEEQFTKEESRQDGKDEQLGDKTQEKTQDAVAQQQTQVDPLQTQLEAARQRILAEVEADAEYIKKLLQNEVEQGAIVVETKEANIIIRIKERASFPSGQAELNQGFLDVIDRISVALVSMPGRIVVAGHTDSIPISNARFRSNWELSASRAVSVVHEILRNGSIDASRLVVEGRADTVPLAPNDNPMDRAENRRVEIVISRGEDILQGMRGLIRNTPRP